MCQLIHIRFHCNCNHNDSKQIVDQTKAELIHVSFIYIPNRKTGLIVWLKNFLREKGRAIQFSKCK